MRLAKGLGRLALLWLLAVPATAHATTYVMMSDADPADRAPRIVRGRVLEVRAADGRAAVGSLPGIRTRATDEERHGVRDLAGFERWLADRAGSPRDYFVGDDRARTAAVAPSATEPAGGWGSIRWFHFDGRRAENVRWASDVLGQPGLPGGGHRELQAALRAWTRHRGSGVRYTYDGLTNALRGLDVYDGVNAVLFQWPLDEPFDCAAGGLLAIGGAWYPDDDSRIFRGRSYLRIVGADVVVNRGLECLFASSTDPERAAHELLAHELGHTLGLGHSCGDEASDECLMTRTDQALMRAYIHDDGRGAALRRHDRAAICALYPRGSLSPARCAAR